MLQSMGSQRVGHNLLTEQQQQRIYRNRLVKAREISGEKKRNQIKILRIEYWKESGSEVTQLCPNSL